MRTGVAVLVGRGVAVGVSERVGVGDAAGVGSGVLNLATTMVEVGRGVGMVREMLPIPQARRENIKMPDRMR
jgi:hypothetical protein